MPRDRDIAKRAKPAKSHAPARAKRDTQTGSTWDIYGQATGGELEGSALEPVRTLDSFWFDRTAFHPETEIWDGGGL